MTSEYITESRHRERVLIRNANSQDIFHVNKIDSLSCVYAWKYKQYFLFGRCKDARIAVAENLDGVVVGFICYYVNKESIVILKVAVHPDFRRTGVGSQILDRTVKQELHDNKTTNRIYCITSNLNGTAHLFFRDNGFESIGTIDIPTSDGGFCEGYEFQYKSI